MARKGRWRAVPEGNVGIKLIAGANNSLIACTPDLISCILASPSPNSNPYDTALARPTGLITGFVTSPHPITAIQGPGGPRTATASYLACNFNDYLLNLTVIAAANNGGINAVICPGIGCNRRGGATSIPASVVNSFCVCVADAGLDTLPFSRRLRFFVVGASCLSVTPYCV